MPLLAPITDQAKKLAHCPSCRTSKQIGAEFCSRCGKRTRSSTSSARWFFSGLAILVTLLIGLVFTVFNPVASNQSPITVTPDKSSVDTSQRVSRFRANVMSVPQASRIFVSIEHGVIQGVVKLQVSNVWLESRPYQRKQMTQMIATAWQHEIGSDQLAIVHIYDIAGREIAGTSAFGGVWIEGE